MVRYDILGFDSFEEYVDAFMSSLVLTNRTYNFFVDWNKVRNNVRKYIKEINLLNALTKVSNINERKSLLREILINYPEVIPVLPYIIAVREKDLTILEIGNGLLYRYFKFIPEKLSDDKIDELILFAEKTGILELMGEISDLYAYLMGVEVGLDTNARKNRSGSIFQGLVGIILRRKLSNIYSVKIEEEITVKSLNINIRREDKRLDFVIYYRNNPITVIECNFYNVAGSKPLEVAEAYVELNRLLKQKEITFIWITDGPAWRNMKVPFMQAIKEIDFVLNLNMTEKYIYRILEEAISTKKLKIN